MPLTVTGFSAGPLWSGDTLFEIDVDVAAGIITVHVETNQTMFPLEDGKSLKTYYTEIIGTLQASDIRYRLREVRAVPGRQTD